MPVRVLHYVGKMDRGGMETFIMNLYRAIDREKIQFDFAVHGDRNGDYEREILSMGGKFYQFPHMRKNPLKYQAAWKAFWQTHGSEYTAFHFHTNSLANIIALEQAKKAGVPVRIVHAHSSYANKGRLQWLNDFLHKRGQRRLDKAASNLFACSDKAAEWLFGGMSCGKLQVKIVNNAIDISRYGMNGAYRAAIRKEFGFADGDKVIGHIGKFIPVKNHRFLLDTIQAAHRLDPSVKALLVGNGPLLEEIKQEAKAKGLESTVVFAGMREDVEKLLSAMDVFVMPSKYEGLPVSLVEAQANGVPLVVSDTITRDVALNPNMEYCPLQEGSEYWAKRILHAANHVGRYARQDKVEAAGFNIAETAREYTELIEGRKSS